MLTFLALAHMLDVTQVAGLGGDVNVPCACTHVGCYARCWAGVGGMLTFLALAHMLDATQDAWVGVGGILTFLALAHMLDATQDAGLGWGGCQVFSDGT